MLVEKKNNYTILRAYPINYSAYKPYSGAVLCQKRAQLNRKITIMAVYISWVVFLNKCFTF